MIQQKAEYESTLLRHQSFIEQLMANKQELSGKVESLTHEIACLEAEFQKKLTAVLADAEVKFTARQEIFLQQERLKRDAHIAAKTKQIKAMTIKGLEPEIERLMAQSKRDLKAQEQTLQDELQARLDQAGREQENALQQLRTVMIQEREAALEKERQYAQQRSQSDNNTTKTPTEIMLHHRPRSLH